MQLSSGWTPMTGSMSTDCAMWLKEFYDELENQRMTRHWIKALDSFQMGS
jgi:hypothetical protein